MVDTGADFEEEQMQPQLIQMQMDLMSQVQMRILHEQSYDAFVSETETIVKGTADTETNEFADVAANTETRTTAS